MTTGRGIQERNHVWDRKKSLHDTPERLFESRNEFPDE